MFAIGSEVEYLGYKVGTVVASNDEITEVLFTHPPFSLKAGQQYVKGVDNCDLEEVRY